MNQSSVKRFATCTTHPLLKLKRSALLVMYSAYDAFAAILTANTALS